MIRTTRTVVVASFALAVLTGCGGAAAEAKGSHTFEPLPPLSTATPTQSPAPQPTSRPASESSPSPSAEATGEQPAAGQPVVAGGAAQAAAPVGSGMQPAVPGQGAGGGQAPAVGAGAPSSGAGAVGGGAPVQATERTSTSTTTTTSTSLEVGLQIVVTCEGLCLLGDLSAPELSGQGGPVSSDLLRQALEEELGGQGGDQQRLTDELVEQLMQGQWTLAERDLRSGDEKLVFSSARK